MLRRQWTLLNVDTICDHNKPSPLFNSSRMCLMVSIISGAQRTLIVQDELCEFCDGAGEIVAEFGQLMVVVVRHDDVLGIASHVHHLDANVMIMIIQ